MAVGAVFGALNTMYSAVSAHVREIATLRALGFGSTAMVLSVLVDGELVNSCLMPLVHARDASITTIEGVARGDRLHEVQAAFIAHGGAQCGICTPGMVLAAVSLLSRTPEPSLDEVRTALAGNLCRCTGYARIFAAVLKAYQA